MRTTATILLLLVLSTATAAGWEEDLDNLVTTEDAKERAALLESVVAAGPDIGAVASRLRARTFPAREGEEFQLRTTVCTDGVERPWVLFVPESYDPARPTPLFVVLHGGVSRPEVSDDPLAWARGSAFIGLARERGWLAIHPFGQVKATWWDEVGMANIKNLVRTVKRGFNVDDDRVWMAGFSDGASAGFLHAMVAPDDYAAFVALNGHMGVGAIDGDLPCYAGNFANTPVYAVTTYDDSLYPSARMRRMIDMALEVGGRIFYRERQGRHEFTYAADELPRVGDWLVRHPRDPLPARVDWETAARQFGSCRWLAIDRVDATAPRAGWHRDVNLGLVSDRVTIGFNLAEFEGKGVKVGVVMEKTYAEEVGLKAGDVIVRMNGDSVANVEDLSAAKAKVERGDPVELEVLRDGKTVVLQGNLPEPSTYLLFKRESPSARVKALWSGNRITIAASRAARLRIRVHPGMVNLDEPLVVTVNGKAVHEDRVKPDLAWMLRNFLENRDRKLLWVAEVAIELRVQ